MRKRWAGILLQRTRRQAAGSDKRRARRRRARPTAVRPSSHALYGPDLALIHDLGFGDFAERAGRELLSRLGRQGIRRGLVVDLGCGSGHWACALGEAGYEVLGVDVSPSMIAIARKRARRAAFVRSSLFEVALPRCDAVTAIGECVAYRRAGERARGLIGLFRRVYEALRPGGVFAFDFRGPGRAPGSDGPRRAFTLGDGWAVLVVTRRDRSRRWLTRHITTFRRRGTLYRRQVEVHRLQLYPLGLLARQLRQVGFTVRSAPGYGRFGLAEDHHVLIARRPR
jgi:SAM-dependent methyltransferase